MDKTTAHELSERIRQEMPEVQVTVRAKGSHYYGIEAIHTRRNLKLYFSKVKVWKSVRSAWLQLEEAK